MAYSRIRNESKMEVADDEKEELASWLPQKDNRRLLSYKTLFISVLALWITTSAALGWTILRRVELLRNHATTPLPFPTGTTQEQSDTW